MRKNYFFIILSLLLLVSGLASATTTAREAPLTLSQTNNINNIPDRTKADSWDSMYFGDDGNELYVYDNGADDLHQFSLSEPYDVSTRTEVYEYTNTQASNHYSVTLSEDGTDVYIGDAGDQIQHHKLSTPWDLSTASHYQTATTPNSNRNLGLDFSSDGTKMYASGYSSNNIYEYNLATAWDPSTATESYVFDMDNIQKDELNDLQMDRNDGNTLVVLDRTDKMFQLEMNSYDLSTATLEREYDYSNEDSDSTGARGMVFTGDGRFYIAERSGEQKIFEYEHYTPIYPSFNSKDSNPNPPELNQDLSFSADLSDTDETCLDLEFSGQTVVSNECRTGTNPSWDNIFNPDERGESITATFTASYDNPDQTTTTTETLTTSQVPVEPPNNPNANSPTDGASSYFEASDDAAAQLEADVSHPQDVGSVDVTFYGREQGETGWSTVDSLNGVSLSESGGEYTASVSADWTRNGEPGMYGFDRGSTYEWAVKVDDGIESTDNRGSPFSFTVEDSPVVDDFSPTGGQQGADLSVGVQNPASVDEMSVEFWVQELGTDMATDQVFGQSGTASVPVSDSLDPGSTYNWYIAVDDGNSRTEYNSNINVKEFTVPEVLRVVNRDAFIIPTKRPEEPQNGNIWIESNRLAWYYNNKDAWLQFTGTISSNSDNPEGSIWVDGEHLYWVGVTGEETRYRGTSTGETGSSGNIWIEDSNGDGTGLLHYVDSNGNVRVADGE